MPDPNRSTISATEQAALLNVSPYATRFMLFERFAKGVDISRPDDGRMNWGEKMEPLVLAQSAEELALEVIPNRDENGKGIYVRRGLLGATRDATIIAPDRGPGAFDAKCVFDYGTLMRNWDGGKSPPKHVEIQIQQQMYVGDGSVPYSFGYIALWCGGEQTYFEREPMKDLWAEFEKSAETFFDDVKAGRAPDPFGDPIEAPFLKLLDRPAGSVIDLAAGDEGEAIARAEKVREYVYWKKQESAGAKNASMLKAQVLAMIGSHEAASFYGGIRVDVKISHKKAEAKPRGPSTSLTLKPWIPDQLPDDIIDGAKVADLGA